VTALIKYGGKLGLTDNKSTSYAWTCLFNCTVHAYDLLCNILRHCEVITAFIFDTRLL